VTTNRLDIFVTGPGSRMYHKAWDGSKWYPGKTQWDDLGGELAGVPAVVSWGPNRLDIFVTGPGSRMYHKAWDGSKWYPGKTQWDDLGGELAGVPAVVSWGRTPGQVEPPTTPPTTPSPTCSVEFFGFGGQGFVEVRIFGGGFSGLEPIRIDQDGAFATTTNANGLGNFSVVLSVLRAFPPRTVVFQAFGLNSGRTSSKAGFSA
jgi:hypothetical protein